jgi:hypothetical protein
MKKHYAVYKGDKFLVHGTADECAKFLNVPVDRVLYWSYPSYWRKFTDPENRILSIVVEDD